MKNKCCLCKHFTNCRVLPTLLLVSKPDGDPIVYSILRPTLSNPPVDFGRRWNYPHLTDAYLRLRGQVACPETARKWWRQDGNLVPVNPSVLCPQHCSSEPSGWGRVGWELQGQMCDQLCDLSHPLTLSVLQFPHGIFAKSK